MRVSKLFGCAYALFALAAGTAGASEHFATYRVVPASSAVMQEIADGFEVLRRLDGGAFEVVVPQGKLAELQRLQPNVTLLDPDMHSELTALPEVGLYDVASMERKLRELVQRFPNLVKLDTYGTSAGGRPEYVLTMAQDAANPDLGKPGLMITSATHGDEVITVEVTLGLIEKMLVAYGTNQRFTDMINGSVIYWVPAVCVDGYANRSRHVQGADPNRDYAWPESPTRAPRTSCIQHITSLFHAHPNIKGTMDFHAAASMIMFPWAYTYDPIPSPELEVMDDLTTRMAEENRFAHGSIASTIYVAKGSSADYYYWKTGAIATAIEVSHNFAPPREQISGIVEENSESTWRFVEHFTKP